VGKHFFHILVNDMSKEYNPHYQTLMDIPTAVAFFGLRPEETKAKVSARVRALVDAWNEKFLPNPLQVRGGAESRKKKVNVFLRVCVRAHKRAFSSDFNALDATRGKKIKKGQFFLRIGVREATSLRFSHSPATLFATQKPKRRT
jgi:hypothetical protein